MISFRIFLILIFAVSVFLSCDDERRNFSDTDIFPDDEIITDADEISDENVPSDEENNTDADTDADEIISVQTGGFYLFTPKSDGAVPKPHFVEGEGGFFGISFSKMENSEYFATGAHYASEVPFDLENGTGKVYLFKRGTIPETYQDAYSVLMHPLKSKYAGFGYTISDKLCDINGDGNKDFAVSSHLDSVGGKSSCGSIVIFYGNSENSFTNKNEVKQIYISDELRSDRDSMGQSLDCFDYNADGYADIFAGGQNAGRDLNPGSTGMTAIFDGSENGISVNELFTIVPELQESQQYFGSSLVAYDFNDDGTMDVAIGGWGLKENENDVNRGGVFIYNGRNDFHNAVPESRIFPDSLEKIMFASVIKIIDTGSEKFLAVASEKGIHIFSFDSSFPESSSEKLLSYENNEISDFDYIPDFNGKNNGAIVAGNKYGGDGGLVFVFKYKRETKAFSEGELFLPESVVPSGGFGNSVKNLGDIDGDGLSDFAIGVPEYIKEN